jgi:diaminopimelate epimerase/ribosomal protein S18 acetylase RimI-like enzyme
MKEMLLNNEINQNQIKNYKFNVVKPGGNDTCLIYGKIDSPTERKRLNDLAMGFYPNVEQVGFLENNELVMAGGEFCGNATRSAALLLLNGEPGEINIKVSGVKNYLKAGVRENGETYSEMPIFNNTDKVISIERNDPSEVLVEMEGISHLINFNYQQIENLPPDEIKRQAKNRIDELNLNQLPAAGVIYVKQQKKGQYSIIPVVYVRDIDTLFLETACGSGTTALGLVLAKNKGSSIDTIPIIQPSGMPIKISVDYDGNTFNKATIEGPVEIVSSGELNNNYAIEKIETRDQLESVFNQGLPQLFIEIFSQPPYQEKFSIDEAKSFFKDYLSYGNVFICKNQKEIIGFSASIPLIYEEEISKLVSSLNIKSEDTIYFAELGVSNNYRKQGVGINLTQEIINSTPIGKNILLRTSENNNKAIPLYKKLGFQQLPIFQEVEQARVNGSIDKDRRVFYFLKKI